MKRVVVQRQVSNRLFPHTVFVLVGLVLFLFYCFFFELQEKATTLPESLKKPLLPPPLFHSFSLSRLPKLIFDTATCSPFLNCHGAFPPMIRQAQGKGPGELKPVSRILMQSSFEKHHGQPHCFSSSLKTL